MNISQVKAKARGAAKRREDEIEQEEIEGGEINLVPYLDIVTNLMLFMLAAVSTVVLGQINTTLPNAAPASAQTAEKPEKQPDEQPLKLVVSVTKQRVYLWSASGLEGTLQEPKFQTQVKFDGQQGTTYDLQGLNQALYEIAERRYKGKKRPLDTYEVVLQIDGDIAYETVIDTMDVLRRKLPEVGMSNRGDPKTMPAYVEDTKEVTEAYDPEKHYLFRNVLFAKPGFN